MKTNETAEIQVTPYDDVAFQQYASQDPFLDFAIKNSLTNVDGTPRPVEYWPKLREAWFNSEIRENSVAVREWNAFMSARAAAVPKARASWSAARDRNAQRADRASCALDYYANCCGDGTRNDPVHDQVTQMMAYTLHLMRREDPSESKHKDTTLAAWLGQARMAWINYEAECEEAHYAP